MINVELTGLIVELEKWALWFVVWAGLTLMVVSIMLVLAKGLDWVLNRISVEDPEEGGKDDG